MRLHFIRVGVILRGFGLGFGFFWVQLGAAQVGVPIPAREQPQPQLQQQFQQQNGNQTDQRLKDSVEAAQKELGELEPWQKTIYSTEVVPEYKRFVQSYQAEAGGLKITVDYESLKQYLYFYAPKFLKKQKPSVLILLKTDPQCLSCSKVIPTLENKVRLKMEHRGFTPVFLKEADFPFQPNPYFIQTRLTQLAQQQGADATLLVYWAGVKAEAMETAYAAEESRYMIWTLLRVGEMPVLSKQQELLEMGQQFEVAQSRVLTDLLTDLGNKIRLMSEQAARARLGGEEILLEVTGVDTFIEYQKLKDRLQEGLKTMANVDPRQFSPGKVTFLIDPRDTKINFEELKSTIDRIGAESKAKFNLKKVVQ